MTGTSELKKPPSRLPREDCSSLSFIFEVRDEPDESTTVSVSLAESMSTCQPLGAETLTSTPAGSIRASDSGLRPDKWIIVDSGIEAQPLSSRIANRNRGSASDLGHLIQEFFGEKSVNAIRPSVP